MTFDVKRWATGGGEGRRLSVLERIAILPLTIAVAPLMVLLLAAFLLVALPAFALLVAITGEIEVSR